MPVACRVPPVQPRSLTHLAEHPLALSRGNELAQQSLLSRSPTSRILCRYLFSDLAQKLLSFSHSCFLLRLEMRQIEADYGAAAMYPADLQRNRSDPLESSVPDPDFMRNLCQVIVRRGTEHEIENGSTSLDVVSEAWRQELEKNTFFGHAIRRMGAHVLICTQRRA